MPDDVNGGHTLPASYFVQDGDTVLPEQHNPPFEDVSNALTNRLHRDGRTLWTGNQNANSNRLTNLANGVNPQDAATIGQAVLASTPIAAVVPYAGATAPPNWLFAYGQAVSRVTYAACYLALGGALSPWGQGDGSTTFNLPDCRDYAIVGKGNMGGSAANRITVAGVGLNTSDLGAAGGSQTHVLTLAQMPVHTHAANTASAGAHTHTGTADSAGTHTHTAGSGAAGDHAHSGTTNATGNHQHNYSAPQATIFFGGGGGQNVPSIVSGTTTAAGDHSHTLSTNTTGSHTHAITVNSGGAHMHSLTVNSGGAHTHTVTVDNAGSGAAHPNVQPSLVMNYIIRVV